MNRSHLGETAIADASRPKAAAFGFAVTVAPIAAVAAAQFALIPHIIGAIEGLDSGEQIRAVSILRRDWLTFHAAAGALVALYWVLAAAFAKRQLLRSRAANVTLALFVFSLVAFAVYGSSIQWPDELKGLCPLLNIPDTYPNPFGFDAQSSCDVFVQRIHMIIILGLLGFAVALLLASAVLRIVSSRRASPF